MQAPGGRAVVGELLPPKDKDKGKKKGPAGRPPTAEAVVNAKVRPALREKLKADGEFQSRDQVYLLGGITWVMATTQQPRRCVGKAGRYVKLSVDDIEKFRSKVNEPGHYLKNYKLPSGLSEEDRRELSETLERQASIFKTREDLMAGAEILHALAEEMQLGSKTVWFDRRGHVAWLSLYLEEREPQ
jgi:hypothetical protein